MNQELITIVHSSLQLLYNKCTSLVHLQTCKLACTPKCTRLVNPCKLYLFDLCEWHPRGHMVWPLVFIFVYYLSAMSKKLEDDGKTATTTLPLPQTYYQNKKSTCNFPNPIGRQAHANFTMTDCCSDLSRRHSREDLL